MYNRVSIQILISLSIIFLQSTAQIKYASSFRIDLIHIDSPQSPFYNKSISQSELIARDVQRSHARVNSLRTSSRYANEKVVESMMIGNGLTYLTKYRLGSERFKILAFASPTTNFIWTNPKLVNQDAKSFVRGDSNTYRAIKPNDPICEEKIDFSLPSSASSTACKYDYKVSEQEYSRGEVGEDDYYFGSSKSNGYRRRRMEKVYFGCSEENSDLGNDVQGVVGFGPGTISLVSQLGESINNKFTYCLHPTENKVMNSLWFGNIEEGLEEMMVSSPLQLRTPDASKYYLHLKGISVGDDSEEIETSHLILIDYQTPYTHLRRSVYQQVEQKIRTILLKGGEPILIDALGKFNLCFRKRFTGDLSKLQKIVFHFAEEASMDLLFANVFVEHESKMCLAIFPLTIEDEDEDEHSILGSRAQVNHPMMFDIKKNRVSFTFYACRFLEGKDY